MPLDTRQWNLPPKACFEDMAARSFHLPDAHCLQPPPFKPLLWTHHDKETPYGKRFSLSDMRSWCAATPRGGAQILDQSGNQTRLLHCPFPLTAEPFKLSELQHSKEEFDDKYINGKESEMHEDTEEINALLYSDDDEEDCESDDEVMSTAHSPYQLCNKRQLGETDGPCKRQKLLDKVEDTGSGLSNEQSRKDKIRTALKILESIVPGAKGNEALLLLDEAIDYLKLLKQDLISTEIKA